MLFFSFRFYFWFAVYPSRIFPSVFHFYASIRWQKLKKLLFVFLTFFWLSGDPLRLMAVCRRGLMKVVPLVDAHSKAL